MKFLLPFLLALPCLALGGCISHAVRVEPITVEPVRVSMDVNLHVDDRRTPDPPAETADDATPAEPASAL